MKSVIAIVGTRPQFIKHFAFEKACEGRLDLKTIHTGQHYDESMSNIFFNQLGLKKPDYSLDVRSGSHAFQTAKMMVEIENVLIQEKPDFVVVYGDTNSTLAGSLVASKLGIGIAHIEAGLRSNNKEMPEEINRKLSDHISDLLFAPSEEALKNLAIEGIERGVYLVGDIMKDVIKYYLEMGLVKGIRKDHTYYYATIHRPYNTDDEIRLVDILSKLNQLKHQVIFSLHPRTASFMKKYNIDKESYNNIEFIDPQPYLENLSYLKGCEGLITDSGGMQKEAYWLEKKCITIRKETEWIETLNNNANQLVFENLADLEKKLAQGNLNFVTNLYGDGDTADKIVSYICNQ